MPEDASDADVPLGGSLAGGGTASSSSSKGGPLGGRPSRSGSPRNGSSLKMRMVIAGLIVVGAVGYAVAALLGGGSDAVDVMVRVNPAVNRLIPHRDDRVLQQSRVAIDLDARYRLISLVIYSNDRFFGGIDVTSYVRHESGTNLWQFTPGEGQPIRALPPATACATAVYALISHPDETNSVSWCFEVA